MGLKKKDSEDLVNQICVRKPFPLWREGTTCDNLHTKSPKKDSCQNNNVNGQKE